MINHGSEIKIFSGNSNRPLAQAIASKLNTSLGDMELTHFSDGEIYVRYIENPLKSDGKYYWYVAFVPAAQPDTSVAALLDASTGALMATRK